MFCFSSKSVTFSDKTLEMMTLPRSRTNAKEIIIPKLTLCFLFSFKFGK